MDSLGKSCIAQITKTPAVIRPNRGFATLQYAPTIAFVSGSINVSRFTVGKKSSPTVSVVSRNAILPIVLGTINTTATHISEKVSRHYLSLRLSDNLVSEGLSDHDNCPDRRNSIAK